MTPHGTQTRVDAGGPAGAGPSVAGLSVLSVAPDGCDGRQAAALEERLRAELASVTAVRGLRPVPSALSAVPPLGEAWCARSFLRELRSAISRSPDVAVIHVPSWRCGAEIAAPALSDLRDAGVRRILRWTGGDADSAFAEHAEAAAAIVSAADEVVVASPWMADVFRRRFSLVVRIVPDFVRDPAQSPPPAREGGPLRLFAARELVRAAGVDVVLQACALAAQHGADFHLTVAGDGPERAALEALAQHGLAGRVTFAGALSGDRLAAQLDAADVFVNGSWIDDAPVGLAEALSSGVPVVSTDPGGVPWLVQHGRTGLLSPVGDADALGRSIAALARDRAVAVDLGWRAKVEALRWTWTAVSPGWRAALRGVPVAA